MRPGAPSVESQSASRWVCSSMLPSMCCVGSVSALSLPAAAGEACPEAGLSEVTP